MYCFFDLGPRWGWVVNARLRPLYPGERDPIPIIQEVVWTPRKILGGSIKSRLLLGFNPRTVKSVASSYTDGAIPAPAM
jgi:hypothetical protein